MATTQAESQQWKHVTLGIDPAVTNVSKDRAKAFNAVISPFYIRPLLYKKDSNNKLVYDKNGKPVATHIAADDIQLLYQRKVHHWGTSQDYYTQLDKSYLQLNNAVKRFMKEQMTVGEPKQRPFLAVYHDTSDDCDVFTGEPHWHWVTKQLGSQNLTWEPAYKNLYKKACEVGLLLKCTTVRNPVGLMSYLKRSPDYVFWGCTDTKLMQLFNQAKDMDYDLLTEIPDQSHDPRTDESPQLNLSFGRFKAYDLSATKKVIKRVHDDDDDTFFPSTSQQNSDDEFMNDCVFEINNPPKRVRETLTTVPGSQSITSPKPTTPKHYDKLTSEQFFDILSSLVKVSGATSPSDLVKYMTTNQFDGKTKGLMAGFTWPALYSRHNFAQIVAKVLETEEAKADTRSLIDILMQEEVMPEVAGQPVATPEESAINFMAWCALVFTNWVEVVLKMWTVLNRLDTSINAFVVKGPSTIGKSYWFINPWQALINKSVIGTATCSANFGFQDCINKKLILVNELSIMPQNVSGWKAALRGDFVKVQVKNRPDAQLSQTPIIACCNNDPWTGLPGVEIDALKARMFYFDLPVFGQQAGKDFFQGARHPNPKMWLVLAKMFEPDIREIPMYVDNHWNGQPGAILPEAYQSRTYMVDKTSIEEEDLNTEGI